MYNFWPPFEDLLPWCWFIVAILFVQPLVMFDTQLVMMGTWVWIIEEGNFHFRFRNMIMQNNSTTISCVLVPFSKRFISHNPTFIKQQLTCTWNDNITLDKNLFMCGFVPNPQDFLVVECSFQTRIG
jgi:hypothetical protein